VVRVLPANAAESVNKAMGDRKGSPRQTAGAGSGVHRLKVDKPRPFKPEEQRNCGGKIKRAKGGSVGSDQNPFSSAAKGK
jgi:hypothetical protein